MSETWWDSEPEGKLGASEDMADLDSLYGEDQPQRAATVVAKLKPKRAIDPAPLLVGVVVATLGVLCTIGQDYVGVDYWLGLVLVGVTTAFSIYAAQQRGPIFGVGVGGVSLAMLGAVALSPLLLPLLCVGVITWLALRMTDEESA